MGKEDVKKWLIKAILEIIPIMIGVYLGFLVSDWGTARDRHEQSQVLIESIKAEIKANRALLTKVVDYHTVLRDSSTHYFNNPDPGLSKPGYFQGVQILPLSDSAFRTGIQTGIINELPLSQIQALNKLYTAQEMFNNYGSIILSGVVSLDMSDKAETYRRMNGFLMMTMNDVVSLERNLIASYGKMFDDLEAK